VNTVFFVTKTESKPTGVPPWRPLAVRHSLETTALRPGINYLSMQVLSLGSSELNL